MDFLEAQLVTESVLEDRTRHGRVVIANGRERCPQVGAIAALRTHERDRPGVFTAVVDLVDGDVREQGRLRRYPASGQRAGR